MERIGHRGAKRECPENTLKAFVRAYERGADAIELDVHATRDGVVVVHHDAALGEHAAGLRSRAIVDLDWPEMKAIDLGNGATIPTLAEVLGATPAGARVYVEIKAVGIEVQVAAVIAAHQARCAVHSFDHAVVGRMLRLAPKIPRGILFEHALPDLASTMAAVQARDVWPEWPLVDPALVDQVHAAGGRVIAWTVNDRSVAAKLIGMGVDGLCSDDLRLLEGL